MDSPVTSETVATPDWKEARYGVRVVCAALRLSDGRIICGVRHLDQLMRQHLPTEISEAQKVLAGHEQGFVDNRYRFLTREEAYVTALVADQFDPHSESYSGIRGMLFSEDVW